MNKTDVLRQILADRPSFHRPDESPEGFRAYRSALPLSAENRAAIASMKGRQDWGISQKFAEHLLGLVKPDMQTIETGAGISTLVFALGGSKHTALTPFADELEEIQKYANSKNIDIARVRFIPKRSEEYLPTLLNAELDIVFIDGMHAFPWPIIDWYHTADQLKIGGLMILDDTQIRSIGILAEFLRADAPRWKLVGSIDRTDIFRKVAQSVHDVSWHEQPWTIHALRRPFLRRLKGRLRHLANRFRSGAHHTSRNKAL
jgi:predicted O-methyltransferase YrrM